MLMIADEDLTPSRLEEQDLPDDASGDEDDRPLADEDEHERGPEDRE
jgi:hypothetical protein